MFRRPNQCKYVVRLALGFVFRTECVNWLVENDDDRKIHYHTSSPYPSLCTVFRGY